MSNRRALDALAGACYDAALGHISWDSLMAAISATLHGTHVTLLQQKWSGSARVIAATGFDTTVIASYETYYKDRNILLQTVHQPAHAHLWRLGVIRASEMFCPDVVLLRSEYYNEFLRPLSVRRLISTTLCERDGVQLSVWQDPSQAQAARRDFRSMAFLAPHLRRALQVHERIRDANVYRSVLEDYLARISRGAALLHGSGDVLYINDAMRRILAARDGLVSHSSRLSAQSPTVGRTLNGLIASAISGGTGGRVPIPRMSGAAPYQVLVSRLGNGIGPAAQRGGALIIVSDPTCEVQFDRAWLQQVYGFTSTESEVACYLADGSSVEEVADRMQIALGTVRTHLKRVLQKTQTHRQADLVRLLLLGRTLP